jgi:hypothetical protein
LADQRTTLGAQRGGGEPSNGSVMSSLWVNLGILAELHQSISEIRKNTETEANSKECSIQCKEVLPRINSFFFFPVRENNMKNI